MVTFSIILFVVSFLAIAALFAGKYVEVRTGRVFADATRDKADEQALKLKALALWMKAELGELPERIGVVSRFAVHLCALLVARGARVAEERAHQLAEFMSHKRGFERREARSEFLRKVGEAKSANGSRLDTTL